MPVTENLDVERPASKNRYAILWAGVLFMAFLAICAVLFDAPVMRTLGRWPASEQAFFRWITQFGEGAVVLVPALVLWLVCMALARLDRSYWRIWSWRALSAFGGFTFAAVAVPGLATAILKRIFGRARPVLFDTQGALSFKVFQPVDWTFQSFPSGHSTTSLAFAVAVALLFGRKAYWVFLPAGLIALSRIVIQMHFLSDVLAGMAIGSIGAVLVAQFWRQRGWIFAPDTKYWRNRLAPVLGRQWRRIRIGRR